MGKRRTLYFVVVVLGWVTAYGYPADHREDTILPFGLSPGNVNLEKYLQNKYPKPGSSGVVRQKEETLAENNPNGVQENPEGNPPANNDHALFRQTRSANFEHIHGRHGSHHRGHYRNFDSPPAYGYHYNQRSHQNSAYDRGVHHAEHRYTHP